jgi:signal transduction histidine kinase
VLDTPGGHDRVIVWTARALADGGLMLVGHDLTENRRLEREVERGRRGEEVSSLASQLVHDIQTPLTAALVAEGGLERQCAASLQRPVVTLRDRLDDLHAALHLMVDLLASWKSLAGAIRLDVAPLSVGELAREAVHQLAPVAAERGIQLRCELAPCLPVVRADRLKLRRMLDNLLRNAMEAIDRGPGHVTLRVDPAGDGVAIVVSDNGPGLAKGLDVFAPLVTT